MVFDWIYFVGGIRMRCRWNRNMLLAEDECFFLIGFIL